ncbi:hypothetical protein NEMIN01_0694 [Nematocida minor]|uniref:uncharacterized protein n=1 Tax=Nematocida minor TaxID=1912983 RepID=UPI00221E6D08|nr:uncharacterized protein NEMIN01_0694 [Nematocida minor]KAI5189831.1 hypothetical protein NEMIN01_0694 [Nematocida minor]
MKSQKLRKLLRAGAVLLLFILGCRAGWENLFREEAENAGDLYLYGTGTPSMMDYIGYPSDSIPAGYDPIAPEYVPDVYPQLDWQYMAEPSTSSAGTLVGRSNDDSAPSRDENTAAEAAVGPYLSSSNLLMDDSIEWYGEYHSAMDVPPQPQVQPAQQAAEAEVHAPSSGIAYGYAGASCSEVSITQENSSYFDFSMPYVENPRWSVLKPSETIDDMIKQYILPLESIDVSVEGMDASVESESVFVDRRNVDTPPVREKETVKKMSILRNPPALWSTLENSPSISRETANASFHMEIGKTAGKKKEYPNENYHGAYRKTCEGVTIENLDTEMWSSERLSNVRRYNSKIDHKNIYIYNTFNKFVNWDIKSEPYQQQLRKNIEDFSAKIALKIGTNALWYFIACVSPDINQKYKDLLAIREIFRNSRDSLYKNMIKGFKGYYPGAIEEIIAYVEKHQPLMAAREGHLIGAQEKIGDIYMRVCCGMEQSMLVKQSNITQIEKKYYVLAYAVHMLIALPEVYQDFYNITREFIEAAYAAESNSIEAERINDYKVLFGIHKIVQRSKEEKGYSEIYGIFYLTLESIYGKKVMEKLTAIDLYRKMYTILGKFYDKVEMVDARNGYVLAGKCIIANQKYIRCEIVVNTAPKEMDKRVLSTKYSLEENRWGVSPDIQIHYHVYYVNNTLGQVRMVCMPLYIDSKGRKHCLHTVNEIVKYIKTLYKIESHLDVVHPFKTRKGTRKWSYIKKKERDQTLKDLIYYEVVFYHIEEALGTAKFTFAEFKTLAPHEKDSISVPLFLTRVMRTAVELGPFVRLGEDEEIDSIEFEEKEPYVYEYIYGYAGLEYSDVHKYYSNLYIPLDRERRRRVDCYTMECKASKQIESVVKVVWYARMLGSVDEYTHCIIDKSFRREENAEKLSSFNATVESRENNKDSRLHGFWLGNVSAESEREIDSMQMICNWPLSSSDAKHMEKKTLGIILSELEKAKENFKKIEEKQKNIILLYRNNSIPEIQKQKKLVHCAKNRIKTQIRNLHKQVIQKLLYRRPDSTAEFMVFRNVNESKSNLGAHNEILDVLISRYNFQRQYSKEQK